MDKTIRRLPDAELEVMQAVWACEAPVARADIDAKLKDTHPMALTTLLTVLTRLADKGFLRIEKQGRSARYIPLVRREEYLAQQSRRISGSQLIIQAQSQAAAFGYMASF